jgi:hypothetical protein
MLAVAPIAGAILVSSGTAATATQDQPVIAGTLNTATNVTEVDNQGGPGTTAIYGNASSTGSMGVWGSGAGIGVVGSGGTTGVSGNGSTGVKGSGTTGVEGTGTTGVAGHSTAGNGVWGQTSGSGSSGVYGENDANGYGVAGSSSTGVGVLAQSAGTALQVYGRSTFSTAGTAVIASGQKKVTVTLAGVATSDFVLATVQGSGSFYVKNATAGTGQFTIFINKAPAAPKKVTVGYFVISAT